jgi:hypothetical protein
MPMKDFSDVIGNRTHDLPACTTVPQPTEPPHAPDIVQYSIISYMILKMTGRHLSMNYKGC